MDKNEDLGGGGCIGVRTSYVIDRSKNGKWIYWIKGYNRQEIFTVSEMVSLGQNIAAVLHYFKLEV